jgi:Predicted HD superfamily hydrolase
MTIDYQRKIEVYIRQEARPIDKYSHQVRLYRLACQIGAGLDYDDEILHAAVWLHDLGVFIGHRPEDIEQLRRWDNIAYAAQKVPMLLEEWGFPSAKIAGVVDAIRNHLPSGKPNNIEGIILRDADMLEQLGAVGILRTVSKVGRDTRYHTFGDAIATLESQLHKLPTQLQLAKARELAQPRIAALQSFLAAASAESDGIAW